MYESFKEVIINISLTFFTFLNITVAHSNR